MHPTSFAEHVLIEMDKALRTVFKPTHRPTERPTPGPSHLTPLSPSETRHVAGLMRINHTGEVCAQALYQGQALTARLTDVKAQMEQAAIEEIDHLAWCEVRLHELNSQPSFLNPLWYVQSFFIGAFAGLVGDSWSLGFVAETERQVTAHLTQHLKRLPPQDERSKAILEQMHIDEAEHAELAIQAGARELPNGIKQIMRFMSKIMTKISYYM